MQLVRETGRPIAQVARALRTNEGTLENWIDMDRQARDGDNTALREPERVELVRFQREVTELRMRTF